MSSPVITFIGAGSTVFARALLNDLFMFPELTTAEIRLMDIDPDRLADSEAVAKRVAAERDASATIIATTDRERALDGADYVVNMIQVGGYRPATVIDFDVPDQFGVKQTIGDTLGIGGIMRGLRTIPVLNGIAADMERLCPSALLLNYTNPMATLMWGLARASSIKAVGLCHSVQWTAIEIADFLDIPSAEIEYHCAGINHMAFYLKLEQNGQDLYPALKSLQESGDYPAYERVRFTLLRDFGYFVTESSEHFSEYVPWYIKNDRPDLIERFNIPLNEYPARCEDQIADWAVMRRALTSDDPGAMDVYREQRTGKLSGMWERRLALGARENPEIAAHMREHALKNRAKRLTGHSGEYGTLIIHSMETDTTRVINGNVPNNGAITNLPIDCCVEVPCLVNKNGIQPTIVGSLPPQLASLMQTSINVQRMTVEAALTGSRDSVYQAAMLDPHTAAVLDPDQIRALVDALLHAHAEAAPAYA